MASITQVGEQLEKFLISSSVPIIDLRASDDFIKGHIEHSANFPHQSLFERLHELPQKTHPLRIVASGETINEACDQLKQKGYTLTAQLEWSSELHAILLKQSLLQTGKSQPRLWRPAPVLEFFIDQLTFSKATKQALDLGCGSGRDSVYLALNGWQVTAVDYLPAALKNLSNLATNHQVSINGVQIDLEQKDKPLDELNQSYDLIVVIRYLHRPLLPQIRDKILPGGYVVYQTFMQGCEKFGKPKNPRFLLEPGELANIFTDFEVMVDKIEHLNDGRPTNIFIARKKQVT